MVAVPSPDRFPTFTLEQLQAKLDAPRLSPNVRAAIEDEIANRLRESDAVSDPRPWRRTSVTPLPSSEAILLLPGYRPLIIPCQPRPVHPELELMTPHRLRECLVLLRWSQRELARALEINEATVRKWARGALPIPGPVEPWLESLAAVHAALPSPKGWKDDSTKNA